MQTTTMTQGDAAGDGRARLSLSRGQERLAWLAIALATLASRLYELGHRVMSHDESLHVYYAWKLFAKGEYIHDPMMHGPVLYHGTALMYFLFGDNDTSARLFSVILGLLLVLSPWLLRKWLGQVGALATGLMLVISPSVMYYTRYIRHDIHVLLFMVMIIIGFIRYLDSRQGRWIVMAFAGGALGIASAEMSYIHGFVLVAAIMTFVLAERLHKRRATAVALTGVSVGIGLLVFCTLAKHGGLAALLPTSTAATLPNFNEGPASTWIEVGFLASGLLMIFPVLMRLLAGFHSTDPVAAREGDEGSRPELTLGELLFPKQALVFLGLGVILLVVGRVTGIQSACVEGVATPVCSLASGLLASGLVVLVYGVLSWILDARDDRPLATSLSRAPAVAVALAIVAFLVIYTVFFTTFFSTVNKSALQGIDGFERSIRYWFDQHKVVRGDQPWYYYLMMVPLYEFLPLVFGVGAVAAYARDARLRSARGDDAAPGSPPALAAVLFVPLLMAWMVSVYWIFSWAGEKMPWLTVHMAVPLAFLAGRWIADLADSALVPAVRERLALLGGLQAALVLLAAVQLAALMYADQGWPVLTFVMSLAAIALLARATAGMADRRVVAGVWIFLALLLLVGKVASDRIAAGQPELFGSIDHLITAVPKVLWSVAAAIGRSLAGVFPALQAAGPSGLARGGLGLLAIVGLVVLLARQAAGLPRRSVVSLGALVTAVIFAAANLFVALRANFQNEELATEFLVYAHATDEDNVSLERMRALQRALREQQGAARDLKVGYDNEVSWPMTWYFRNDSDRKRPDTVPFPGATYLGESAPGLAQLKEYDVVLVGSPNYGKFDDYLEANFNEYELDRMWWPNEGYKGLSLDSAGIAKLLENFRDPNMRRNVMNIVLHRKYVVDPRVPTKDAEPKSLDDWFHHSKMKMWVNKAIDGLGEPMVFTGKSERGPGGTAEPEPTKVPVPQLETSSDLRFQGDDTSLLLEPKGIEIGPDGLLYVVDHGNKRVMTFGLDGAAEGTVADGLLAYDPDSNASTTEMLPSAWGVGVGAGGEVYVADTWNHRVLKFVDGKETARVGAFGSVPTANEQLEVLYGPRDVAVDAAGQVYVTDTGNKRVVVFDANLRPLRAFGGGGLAAGQLNEPSGIAIDPSTGDIVVADLWNLRVQVFDKDLRPLNQFPVEGWESQDANHKAYIAVAPDGTIAFTDPEHSRLWFYDRAGKALGRIGVPQDETGMNTPIGVAFDAEGRVYVASSASSVVSRFPKPAFGGAAAGGPTPEGGATPSPAGSEAAATAGQAPSGTPAGASAATATPGG